MILGRLFTRCSSTASSWWRRRTWHRDELYKDGLNRALFLPFIVLLERHMEVVRLAARTDFRLEKLDGRAGLVRAAGSGGRCRARRCVEAPDPGRGRRADGDLA